MKVIYPAIIHEEGSFWVEFPDLEGCFSDGDSLAEAISNAQDSLGLYITALLEEGSEIPAPSDIRSISSNETTSYIMAETDKYHRSTRAVKKTLSIPEWLAIEADRNNLKLSKILQDAIKAQLGIQ